MIKKTAILLCAAFMFFNISAAQDTGNWNISKSKHFLVYYKNAPDEFIAEVIDKSEECYSLIAESIGFSRFNFWLWDNRAKIYIYDSASEYIKSTRQPEWSNGVSIPQEKMISTFVDSKGFFDSLLPHEMGHIIFREMIGFGSYDVPVWLEEGVASYQEKFRAATADILLREADNQNALIPLVNLARINLRGITDVSQVQLIYAESASVVGFLINEFGSDKFVELCQYLRDKNSFSEAIRLVYDFSSIEELEAAWRRYLRNE